MPTIEQRLQHLEDESAIRELAARFADAATRGDHETVRSLFKPDGVFSIGEPFPVTCYPFTGKAVALNADISFT